MQISTMVFVGIRENDDVVDENVVMITMFFQCSIYKTLYIQRKVYVAYKIDIGTFYFFLTDEDKVVPIVGIYYKLKKEVCYVNNCEVFLSSNFIDDLFV